MRRLIRYVLIIFIMSMVLANGGHVGLTGSFVINIVCTLEPYAGIAEYIGGGLVNVSFIIPEGASPHEYSLSPSDLSKIEKADILIMVNSEFLSIESEIRESFSDKTYVDFPDYEKYNITILPAPGIEQNYHGYWLYPDNAIAIAKAIFEALASIDPTHREIFEANLARFIDKVSNLKDLMISVSMERGLYGIGVLLAVPAVAYVAYSFGFSPKAMILKAPGSFVSGSELVRIEEEIENGEISMALCPESLKNAKPGQIMEEIRRETNVSVAYVRVFSLHGLNDYISLLSYNLAVISNIGLQNTSSRFMTETYIYLLIGFTLATAVAILESIIIFRFRKKAEEILYE